MAFTIFVIFIVWNILSNEPAKEAFPRKQYWSFSSDKKNQILKLRILIFYFFENEFTDFQRAANWLFWLICMDIFCLPKQSVNFGEKKIRVFIFRIGCLIWRTNKFIVPDVIANTPSEFLKVTYSNDEEVVPGSTLTYEEILGKETPNTLCF